MALPGAEASRVWSNRSSSWESFWCQLSELAAWQTSAKCSDQSAREWLPCSFSGGTGETMHRGADHIMVRLVWRCYSFSHKCSILTNGAGWLSSLPNCGHCIGSKHFYLREVLLVPTVILIMSPPIWAKHFQFVPILIDCHFILIRTLHLSMARARRHFLSRSLKMMDRASIDRM